MLAEARKRGLVPPRTDRDDEQGCFSARYLGSVQLPRGTTITWELYFDKTLFYWCHKSRVFRAHAWLQGWTDMRRARV